ncbi:MAG: ankyrin repeat domain-containing protein, partial [Pirellulales bacterium]
MSVFNVTSPFWVPGLLVLFATVASRVDAQQINQALVAFFVDENAKQVAKFLKKGGNPNADYNGRAALHIAASGGHLKVMKLLIDHGADVNAKDRSRRSPLVEAAALLEPQAVKILLEAGAELADSALEVASRNGRIEAAKLLMEAGVRPDAGMAGAASGGHSEILNLLLDKGANVNVRLSDGSTPLHLAARSGGLNTVRLLLGRGADPNATDNKGETPLHSAIAGHSDLESIRLLVQSGANLDVGNEEGVTPVRLAAMRRANVVYDWLLNVAWGKEPPVVLSDAQRETTKSTNELVASLSSRDRQTRLAAQRELVARGQKVMPDVLRAMKEATNRDPFYELFVAMGPDAEAALPMLESQLGDKKLGPFTLFVIEAMKPGAVAELGDETKQKAMAALYEVIADPKTDVMAGFYADFLIRFGKPATPTILRLLRHPEPRYRKIMAGSLATFRYSDEQIQSELVKMSRNDPSLAVRTEAAEALGTVGDLGVHARAGLLAIVNMPTWPHDSFEDRTATDRAARLLGKFGPSIIDDLIP